MPRTKKKPSDLSPVDRVRGLSIRAYADYRKAKGLTGTSAYAVTKALREGRITKNKYGRIDPIQATKDWAANTNPALVRGKVGEVEGVGDAGGIPSYSQSRAIREAYRAKITRLEFEERKGRLLDADTVRMDVFKQARAARDQLLAIPHRLAPVLAALSDPREIESAMETEMRKALEGLAKGVGGE